MPKHKPNTTPPLGAARGQTAEDAIDLRPVPPDGDAPGPIRPPKDDAFLHRVLPANQKRAKAFLDGKSPGIQQRYAPNAQTSAEDGWVEDDETVERLVHWRKEAPYG